jgi:hypothetical protein
MKTHHLCQYCGLSDCQARFHQCLSLDFSDPTYGSVHHLLVASFMLQHHAYDTEAQAVVLAFISAFIDRPLNQYDKQNIRARYDGAQPVFRRDLAPSMRYNWPLTIADVDSSSGVAYQSSVKAWARAVVATLQP